MPGAETLNYTVKRNAKFPWLFALHPQQPCSLSESCHLLLQRAVVVQQPQVGHVAQMALLPGKCGVCSPLWGCSLLSLSPFHTASLERGEWILMLPTIFSRVHWGWKHKAKLGEIPGVQITMGWLEGRLDWCLMKYSITASGCFLSLACLLPDWQGPGFLQSCCAWPLRGKKNRDDGVRMCRLFVLVLAAPQHPSVRVLFCRLSLEGVAVLIWATAMCSA